MKSYKDVLDTKKIKDMTPLELVSRRLVGIRSDLKRHIKSEGLSVEDIKSSLKCTLNNLEYIEECMIKELEK